MTAAIAAPFGGEPAFRIASRSLRTVIVLAVLALAVLVVVQNPGWRDIEAFASARLTHLVTGTQAEAWAGHQQFVWAIGESDVHGLLITPDCSSAFVIGPLLVLGAIFGFGRRIALHHLLFGLVLATSIVFAVNVIRITLIAWATRTWGPGSGFWWSHVVAGTVLTAAGGLIGLYVLVRIAFRAGPPAAVGA